MIYILVLLAVLLIITLVMIFLMYKKMITLNSPKDGEQNLFLMLQQQVQELTRTMDQKMADTHRVMNETQESIHKTIQSQFSQSTRIISDVTERLTKLDETNKQVLTFTDQMKNFEKVLTSSKNRGSLGEAGLELILSNILPPGSFKTQYAFQDGDIVDAAIFIKDQILPVDAKFSLDNYRRIIDEIDPTKKEELERDFKADLKKRIDETAKYIKPKEGTLDFAFMFIPAEGIYYDLLINEVGTVKVNTRSLIDYAFKEKKVIIVSPTTFAAYLQTVLQGLRALSIEESAKEIRKRVEQLGAHLSSFDTYMQKLGNNLGTTVGMFNQAYKELGKIDKDVVKITDGEKAIEPLQIERPKTLEE
ncbi:MAG: DNA recombination protein RmuC [Candidatus Magasanikbacteria bacterium]|nr:DNA recombination protein RmuC [Candidatus Magasanikbacteria bacterium]